MYIKERILLIMCGGREKGGEGREGGGREEDIFTGIIYESVFLSCVTKKYET